MSWGTCAVWLGHISAFQLWDTLLGSTRTPVSSWGTEPGSHPRGQARGGAPFRGTGFRPRIWGTACVYCGPRRTDVCWGGWHLCGGGSLDSGDE